ncbi:hypothetical protein EJB05_54716, partial [Eragrostis curvula]
MGLVYQSPNGPSRRPLNSFEIDLAQHPRPKLSSHHMAAAMRERKWESEDAWRDGRTTNLRQGTTVATPATHHAQARRQVINSYHTVAISPTPALAADECAEDTDDMALTKSRCREHDQHDLPSTSMGHISELPDSSLKPVIGVNLQCRVSPSEYNPWKTAPKGSISLQNPAQLKVGLLFMPHGSSEDLVPANESSATQVVNGGEQRRLLTNISLQQLEEIMMPKAMDYFLQNAEASVYQMLWKSKHGAGYFQVMNTNMKNNQSRRRMIRGARKGKPRRENQGLERQTHVIPHYFDLMVAHAPVRMQGSIMDWIRKERENHLAPPPLCRQF